MIEIAAGMFGAGQLATLLCLFAAMAMFLLVRRFEKADRQSKAAKHLLRCRGQQMSDVLRSSRLVERLSETGVLRYDPKEQSLEWSDGLKVLFGLDEGDTMQAGDGETLLASNGIDLHEVAAGKPSSEGIQSARYTVRALDGQKRVLNVRASQMERARAEQPQVVAVFLNETQQMQQVLQLQESRNVAIREARRAQELASKDPLTNLANRRHVMTRLDRLLTQQNRGGDCLSLIMFDIDHFKQVNDRHGHLAGDAVLRRIARITSEQARDGDVVGRIGGEEFVWVVPGADHDFARIISERLRQAIALGSAVGPVPPVTISIGFATAMKGDSSLALFARADEALYAAKDAGRNTVRMAA